VSNKKAFNNKEVTALIVKYSKNPEKNEDLRNEILELVLPLVNAALVRRNVPKEFREDIRQECALKLLTGLQKFNPERGSAFAFFWTVICNVIATQKQRMTPSSMVSSLSSTTESDSGTDSIGADLFRTPENQYILARLARSTEEAIEQSGMLIPNNRKHRKAFEKLKKAIRSGELFSNKAGVIRSLKKTGLRRSEIQRCVDYALVKIRKYLLNARKELSVLENRSGFTPEKRYRRS
jgi:DNA-directed RNA polymerase specialized sigma24 family protein